MTTSQITTAIATAATVIASIAAKLVPLSDVLPPTIAKWLPVVVVVAGVIVSAFSQSLNPNHVSIPVEEAKALGVAKSQTEGR
jgi:Flp pilus assembly protein protease CpaA